MENLLNVENLTLRFHMYTQGLRRKTITAIRNLSVNLEKGEILAVVGASGSGKSLLADTILGVLPRNCEVMGTVFYKDEELTTKRREALRGREIAFVPQSVDNLDPRMKVGKQVIGKYGNHERQRGIFTKLGLADEVSSLYPFQLSGGMARRVLIATSQMTRPELVVADEPTPGLSYDLAVEVLRQFRSMADQGAGVLLITHDLDLSLLVADRIAVFYGGTIIEIASANAFTGLGEKLEQPYSRALWNALPQNQFIVIKDVSALIKPKN